MVGVLYHLASRKIKNLDALMPYVSMFGIIYFTLVTTAAGRDNLLKVGLLLFISSMGKLGTVGLPAAVFSPWMNISGSLLANYWRRRPVKEQYVKEKELLIKD